MASFQREAGALLLFAALAAGHTRVYDRIATAVYDHVDPLQDAWILRNVTDNVWHRPAHLFEGNNYFPSRDAVLFCDPLLGPAALVAPVRLFTTNPVVLYNLALLGVLTLSSYGWWRLAYLLSGDRAAALLAGVAIPYTPQLASHLYQINLLTSAGYPFLIWGLLRLVERPSWRVSLLTGVAFAFQAGTSGYHAFACAFLSLIVAAWGWRAWRRPAAVSYAAAAAATALLLLLPYILGHLRHRDEAELARPLHWAETWSVDLVTGLFSSHTYAWRGLMPDHGLPAWPGLVLLVLGAVGAWRVRTPHTRLLLLVAGFFFMLALGPRLRVFGHETLPMPYRVLHDHLPLFAAARRAGFFIAPATMAVGLLAVLGARELRLSSRPGVLAVVLILSVAESVAPAFPRRERARVLPGAYAWLRDQPRGALLELPAEDEDNMAYQWWSNLHRLRTANGVTAFEPTWYGNVMQLMRREWKRRPASQDMAGWKSTQVLLTLPIRYLVLHPNANGYAVSHVEATPSVFRPVHVDAGGIRVYAIERGATIEGPVRRRFRDDQLTERLRLHLRCDAAAEVLIRWNDGSPTAVRCAPGDQAVAPPLAPRVYGLNTLTLEPAPGTSPGGHIHLTGITGDEPEDLGVR